MKYRLDENRSHLLAEVKKKMLASAERIDASLDGQLGNSLPSSGKLLRSRLGIELFLAEVSDVTEAELVNACAAVELVHTASLCHDDVIDNAVIRRHLPALWRSTSRSCAVLVGDFLLCEALQYALKAPREGVAAKLLEKVGEVCTAEAKQELCLRSKTLDSATCLQVARGKTGPLFGFVAEICGGGNSVLTGKLEESGYLIGTAYQLADDLIDAIGAEEVTGKTLRNDSTREKYTLAAEWQHSPEKLVQKIEDVSDAAVSELSDFPAAKDAVKRFLCTDLQTTFNRLTMNAGIQWRLTA